MKNTFLPFQIGEQYEKWEFDLEYCKEERIKGCDSYIYLWIKGFLNIIPSSIELVFSLDILELVIMDISPQNYENLAKLPNLMESSFGSYYEFWKEEESACIFKLNVFNEIWLIDNPIEEFTVVAYGNKKMLDLLYGLNR